MAIYIQYLSVYCKVFLFSKLNLSSCKQWFRVLEGKLRKEIASFKSFMQPCILISVKLRLGCVRSCNRFIKISAVIT